MLWILTLTLTTEFSNNRIAPVQKQLKIVERIKPFDDLSIRINHVLNKISFGKQISTTIP
jgi:hypothetical protein